MLFFKILQRGKKYLIDPNRVLEKVQYIRVHNANRMYYVTCALQLIVITSMLQANQSVT